MLTHCPHCQTTFRVTTEQLKVRHGQVRCGACREVFDALDSLIDESSVVIRHAEAPAIDLLIEPVEEIADEETRCREGGGAVEEIVEPLQHVMPEPEPEPEPVSEPAPAQEPESAQEPEPQPEQEPEAPEQTLPEAWAAVPVPRQPRRWPWVIGSIALLLLALGQALYVFRGSLAVRAPEMRPLLAAGCEAIGCTLPRPRVPELVGIEASDLAPEGNQLLLTATLKNRAPFDQEYPHLELTLTDTQDLALVTKALAPADYLPEGASPAAGFAARGEVQIKLRLEAGTVPAVGYRLYLFYP